MKIFLTVEPFISQNWVVNFVDLIHFNPQTFPLVILVLHHHLGNLLGFLHVYPLLCVCVGGVKKMDNNTLFVHVLCKTIGFEKFNFLFLKSCNTIHQLAFLISKFQNHNSYLSHYEISTTYHKGKVFLKK